jgi:hypothetical protein
MTREEKFPRRIRLTQRDTGRWDADLLEQRRFLDDETYWTLVDWAFDIEAEDEDEAFLIAEEVLG